MNPQRWSQIKELFLAASELAPDDRAAFRRDRCGEDSDLLAAIEQLAAAGDASPAFLNVPAAASFATGPAEGRADALVGMQLGSYRVIRRLAVGGMGEVYLATRADEQFDKQVAIKLVRPEILSEDVVFRFTAERQALARLEHNNIARLLDGGVTEDGYPYFVMEYVDGVPIDEYCDAHKLTIAERLSLFVGVCAAVQFAHQHLIVHRDLKPGNLLMTRDGTPKLLDFGIAKLLAPERPHPSGQTVTRQRRLTPEYASPEQIRGEPVSTRSDVFSLGVILYELMAGRHPHRGRSRALYELERLICEEEPERPSTAVSRKIELLDPEGGRSTPYSPFRVCSLRGVHLRALRRELSGDVDAIVLKAMHPSPERRYASAEQLGEDIRRHLTGMPVIARPDTLAYRLRKFARRNVATLAAGALAFVALLLGIVATTWQAYSALAAERHAKGEAERAREEERKSIGVINFFQEMLSAADPRNAGPETTIGQVLDQAAGQVREASGDDPEIESAIHTAVGRTFIGLGRYDAAEEHIFRALEIQTELHEPPHPDIACRHADLAELYYRLHRFEEAEAHARTALEMDRATLGENSAELAKDLNNLAAIRRARGALDEVEPLLREALAIRERLGDQGAVAATLNNLANLLRTQGRLEESAEVCRRALEVRRACYGDRHPFVAQSLDNLGAVLAALKRLDEAEPLHRQAIGIMRDTLGTQHPDLFVSLSNLAGVQKERGEPAEAIALYRESLAIGETFLPEQNNLMLRSRLLLGDCLFEAGHRSEAVSELSTVLRLTQGRDGEGGKLAARAQQVLAKLESLPTEGSADRRD